MTDHDTDVVALLRALPIFAGLDEGVLARIAQRCVARSVGDGHVLFTTGEACRGRAGERSFAVGVVLKLLEHQTGRIKAGTLEF